MPLSVDGQSNLSHVGKQLRDRYTKAAAPPERALLGLCPVQPRPTPCGQNTDGHDTTLPHQPHIICVVAIVVVDVAIVEIDVPSVVGIARIGGQGL